MKLMGSICANTTHNNQQSHANFNLPYARVLSANKTNKGTQVWWYSIMQSDFSSVDKVGHSLHSETGCPAAVVNPNRRPNDLQSMARNLRKLHQTPQAASQPPQI